MWNEVDLVQCIKVPSSLIQVVVGAAVSEASRYYRPAPPIFFFFFESQRLSLFKKLVGFG
jgi:hypothetical protein